MSLPFPRKESSGAVATAIKERQLDALKIGGPGERTAQPLDRYELCLGVVFDLEGTFQQFRMVFLQPDDLRLLAGRTEEAGTLDGYGQTGVRDDLLAPLPVEAPFHQRIPICEVV